MEYKIVPSKKIFTGMLMIILDPAIASYFSTVPKRVFGRVLSDFL
jgi:hypothetical protein